jgi:hypothetical protein
MSQARQTALYLAILTAWFNMATSADNLVYMVLTGIIGLTSGYSFTKSSFGYMWRTLSLVTPDGDMVPVRA